MNNTVERLDSEQRRRDDIQNYLNPDNYLEEPRPNLFNVIKKLREHDNKVMIRLKFRNIFQNLKEIPNLKSLQKAYKRVLYVAKFNEQEAKGELESN